MERRIIEECRQVKAIFFDMDGTLCDGDSRVPEEFPRVVEALREKGILVGIASGRSNLLLEGVFGEEMKRLLGICSNGSILMDRGEIFFQSEIPEETARTVLCELKKIPGITQYVLYPDRTYTSVDDPKGLALLAEMGFDMKYVPNLEAEVAHVNNIGVNGKVPEDFAERIDFEGLGLVCMTSGFQNLDIVNRGISKKVGIHQFCERLGITPQEVMALGDEGNDLEMLQSIGFPVAMKNGILSVRQAARYVTEQDNVHHGALRFVAEAFELPGIYEQ